MEKCKIGNRYYFSSTIEWCVHNSILNFIFNHKYEVRPAFVLDSASLQRRLQVCGVIHLLLLPFLILFVTVHFFLQNVYDFKASKQYMGNSQWSRAALWLFREWNELPHQLEQRMEPSYEAAAQYLKLFGTSEWIAATGKLLVFLGGAAGGVLLVLGVLNDAILLHVQLWGRNLLWYAGIAGLVYSVGKALLPTKEATPSVARNLFDDMDNALKNVSVHTHYYPQSWKGRGWDSNVYKSFKVYFDTKVKLFLWELTSLLLAPYILYFRLSTEAPAICEFCLVGKARVQGVGDVCGFSTFDFDLFKDEAWDGRTLGQSTIQPSDSNNSRNAQAETFEESIMRTGNLEEATNLHPKPRAKEGKMEKSFFSFRAAHPTFKCPESGQKLMECVDDYRDAAMAREQELHIEAAARQLELLSRLEKPVNGSSRILSSAIDRSITETQMKNQRIVPPADAAAGTRHGSQTIPSSSVSPHNPSLGSGQVAPMEPEMPRDELARRQQMIMSQMTTYPPASDGLLGVSSVPRNTIGDSVRGPAGGDHTLSRSSPMMATTTTAGGVHPFPPEGRSMMTAMMTGSTKTAEAPEQNADRQYYWLERFHEHLERQEQGQVRQNNGSEVEHPSSTSGTLPFIADDTPVVNTSAPSSPERGTDISSSSHQQAGERS